MEMKLLDLLCTMHDQQDLDIYLNEYDDNHLLDYHIYGRNAYVSKAFDLSFYFYDVTKVTPKMDKNNIIIQIECSAN